MKFDLELFEQNLHWFHLNEQHIAAIRRAAALCNRSARAQALLDEGPEALQDYEALKPELAEIYENAPGMHIVLSLLTRFPALKAQYASHGIADDILADTMSDLAIWMEHTKRESGEWGLPQVGWLLLHFSFRLFRLGRLQFIVSTSGIKTRVWRSTTGEVVALAPDGERFTTLGEIDGTNGLIDPAAWTASYAEGDRLIRGYPIERRGLAVHELITLDKSEWTPVLMPGDPVLDMHIPEGAPLDPDAARASLDRAPVFFRRYFGCTELKAFTCGSWLLDWAIPEMLPNGNIAAFQQMFYCVPAAGDDGQMFERTFGGPIEDWSTAPVDTTLRRAVRDWYLKGNRCRGAHGFILIDE